MTDTAFKAYVKELEAQCDLLAARACAYAAENAELLERIAELEAAPRAADPA